MAEEEIFEVDEPQVEEPKKTKSKAEAKLEADLVFDDLEAMRWLTFAGARVQKAYNSIALEVTELPKQHEFLYTLVANAIKGDIVNSFGAVVGKGVLFVPEKIADRAEFKFLERGEKVGKYVAFRR